MAMDCRECGASLGGFFGVPASHGDPNICQDCALKMSKQHEQDPDFLAEQQRLRELKNNAEDLAKSIYASFEF
jgi:hypothetical protein